MGGRRLTARRQHERPSKQNNAAPTYTSQSCERSHGRKAVEAPGGRSFPERREVGILVRFCGCIKTRLVPARGVSGLSGRVFPPYNTGPGATSTTTRLTGFLDPATRSQLLQTPNSRLRARHGSQCRDGTGGPRVVSFCAGVAVWSVDGCREACW